MNHGAQVLLGGWLVIGLLAALMASIFLWIYIGQRLANGLPVVPYWHRRPVPWGGLDVFVIFLSYFLLGTLAAQIVVMFLGPDLVQPIQPTDPAKAQNLHLIARLMMSGNIWMLALAGVLGVVVAPIVEEFLFRVVLQGWLEKAERRRRRTFPLLRRITPRAVLPIVFTSLFFASLHIRTGTSEPHMEFLIAILLGHIVVSLSVMVLAIWWLKWRTGATAIDLGWAPSELFSDIRLGLLTFLAMAVPLYSFMILLNVLLPEEVSGDPIALFFFALALGMLCYRTHRIAPSIATHAALNFTSLSIAWLQTVLK